MKPETRTRGDFRHFHPITTRWMDNDAYGHVNNVVYYSWFDTVVNQFLIVNGVLDVERSPVIGLVVETQCNYFASVAFPDQVTAGMRGGCVVFLWVDWSATVRGDLPDRPLFRRNPPACDRPPARPRSPS